MTAKHAYRARRIGLALILAALVCIPGTPGRPGLALVAGALVLFGSTALYAATHIVPEANADRREQPRIPAPIAAGGAPYDGPLPPAPKGPSAVHRPTDHNAAALANTLATVIDIHRGHATTSDDTDVAHVPVLNVPMRPDWKDRA